MDKPATISDGTLLRRLIFSAVKATMLIALSWGIAFWIERKESVWAIAAAYFQNPFRIFFLVYTWAEVAFEYLSSPRLIRPLDEIPADWRHWRNRMWETTIVLAIFSDARGLLPISSDASFRALGVLLSLVSLLLYFLALAERRREQALNPLIPFPTGGIYKSIRFPEPLADLLAGLGTALIFNSWAGLFSAFLTIFVMMRYVSEQDRMMLTKHGEAWLIYQGRVSRWIPMFW